MKHLKKYKLYEMANFPTDEEEITRICEKYEIENYKINPDGSIYVNGDVDLTSCELEKLPLKFSKVLGNFICRANYLTSLEGSPTTVVGDFNCSFNKLSTLEYSPAYVIGNFQVRGNFLTNLKGNLVICGGNFDVSDNRLETLEGIPKEINGHFDCTNNFLNDFTGFKTDLNGRLNCWRNEIYNFNGLPEGFDIRRVDFSYNPIAEVYTVFNSMNLFEKSLSYNYFAGLNKIYESRFVRACDDLGVYAPDHLEGYVWV